MIYKQNISYQGFNPLELSYECANLYDYVSSLQTISTNIEPPMHKGSCDIIDLLYKSMKKPLRSHVIIQGWKYKPIISNNKAYVAFSGGKDGAAKALMLQRMGYDVTLVRVSGLQRDYREVAAAREVAKILNMNLIEVTAKAVGKRDSIESPVKNFVIMAVIADIAYANGASVISLGNHLKFNNIMGSSFKESRITQDWSDSLEPLQMLREMIEEAIPGMSVRLDLLPCSTAALLIVLNYGNRLLRNCHSCQLIQSSSSRKKCEEMYGAILDSRQCGICYKCIREVLLCHYVGECIQPNEYVEVCEKVVAKNAKTHHTLASLYGEITYESVENYLFNKSMISRYIENPDNMKYWMENKI